jgi:hypothetical protein
MFDLVSIFTFEKMFKVNIEPEMGESKYIKLYDNYT